MVVVTQAAVAPGPLVARLGLSRFELVGPKCGPPTFRFVAARVEHAVSARSPQDRVDRGDSIARLSRQPSAQRLGRRPIAPCQALEMDIWLGRVRAQVLRQVVTGHWPDPGQLAQTVDFVVFSAIAFKQRGTLLPYGVDCHRLPRMTEDSGRGRSSRKCS